MGGERRGGFTVSFDESPIVLPISLFIQSEVLLPELLDMVTGSMRGILLLLYGLWCILWWVWRWRIGWENI